MTEAPEPTAPSLGRRDLLPFVAVLAVFAVELAITWQRWADPVIDTGRELNVPARLAAGERLYTDIRYYYGPLGPWLNALLYRLFGLRADVLIGAAIATTGCGLLALYRLARSRLSPWLAALAAALPIPLVMFLPNGGCFALPYSFDALDATVLGWWALVLVLTRSGRHSDVIAGALLGAAGLAKIDVAVQLGLPVVALLATGTSLDRRRLLKLIPGATLLPLIGYFSCARGIPLDTLMGEGFLAAFAVPSEWQQLYAVMMGIDRPGPRLLELAMVAIAVSSILAISILGQRTLGRRSPALERAWPWLVGGGLVTVFSIGLAGDGRLAALITQLPSLVRVLPPTAFAVAVWLGLRRLGGRRQHQALFLIAAAATLSAARVFLNARHSTPYGAFGLVLPVLLAAMLLLAPPLERVQPNWRRLATAMLISWALTRGLAGWLAFRTPDQWAPLVTARGEFMVTSPARAAAIGDTVRFLEQHTRPGDRVATFPEGSIFNFLADRRSPLRQEQVLPGMLDADAERRVISRLEADPPEWVVLGVVDYRAWGVGRFGQDWALELGQFIDQHYQPIATLGDPNDPMATRWANKSVFQIRRLRPVANPSRE